MTSSLLGQLSRTMLATSALVLLARSLLHYKEEGHAATAYLVWTVHAPGA